MSEILFGTALGGGIGILASVIPYRLRRRDSREDCLRETYATWITEVTRGFYGGDGRPQQRDLLWRKLQLLERDARFLKLAEEVLESIPQDGTPEDEEWDMGLQGDPNPNWPPFEKAVDSLVAELRMRTKWE